MSEEIIQANKVLNQEVTLTLNIKYQQLLQQIDHR